MPENPQPKLDALLARLAEEQISEAELGELETLLLDDPEAQARYLRYVDLHQTLEERSLETTAEGGLVPRRGLLRLALLATCLGAALLAALFLWPRGGAEPIAILVASEGPVRWTGDGGKILHNLDAEAPLEGGTLEALAADGWAEIRFPDGSKVALSGPTSLTISKSAGQKLFTLNHGNLSIDAQPQPAGKPLLLTTPSAEAEVLGTQFNVSSDSFRTELTVNEGLVRVTRRADGSREEVSADHLVVAALEDVTPFRAVARKEVARDWHSEFPRDLLKGNWNSASRGVEATTHLWRGDQHTPSQPILLHSIVADPSAGTRPALLLEATATVNVRGRLEQNHAVNVGITTNRLRGGFSGKFDTTRRVTPDADGYFTLQIPLAELTPTHLRFPASAAGHEVAYLWIQTVRSSAGLQLQSVSIEP